MAPRDELDSSQRAADAVREVARERHASVEPDDGRPDCAPPTRNPPRLTVSAGASCIDLPLAIAAAFDEADAAAAHEQLDDFARALFGFAGGAPARQAAVLRDVPVDGSWRVRSQMDREERNADGAAPRGNPVRGRPDSRVA